MIVAPVEAAPERRQPDGNLSMVTRTLLIIAPAVLAAAALRPRGSSAGQASASASTDTSGAGTGS